MEPMVGAKCAFIADLSPISWSQRLGYLLELVGESELAEGLAEYITHKDAVPVPLSPSQPYKGIGRNLAGDYCRMRR